MTSFPSFFKSVKVTNLLKFNDMFHQMPSYLDKFANEERRFIKILNEFSAKFEALIAEFGEVMVAAEQLSAYQDKLGSVFNLSYKEEMMFGYSNLKEAFAKLRDTFRQQLDFLREPLFDFIKLNNEQIKTVENFISKNQSRKAEISRLSNKAIVEKHLKQFEIEPSANQLIAFLNCSTHAQFKTFFVLRSQQIMLKMNFAIQKLITNSAEVFLEVFQ